MQAGKAFTYMFEDESWPSKTLIGALVNMVPILNFAWMGYLIGVLRNVSRDEKPLPLWDDFGTKFMDGLKIGGASLLYTLPATILAVIAVVVFVIPVAAQNNQDLQAVLFGTVSLVYMLICGIVVLYLLAFSFFLPAISIHYARTGTFKSCFEVSQILALVRKDFSGYITAWLLSLVAGIAAGAISTGISALIGWIPCIGQAAIWLFTAVAGVWGTLVSYHLYGQVGKETALA
jgi:hypothetical protein